MSAPPCPGTQSGSLQPLVMANWGKKQSRDAQNKAPAPRFTAEMPSPGPALGLGPNLLLSSGRAPAASQEMEDLRPNFPLNTSKLKRG